jgi:hypothetical protein
MIVDIRNKPTITHYDIIELNFIRAACPYIFRRHYKQGLRSHVIEVLKKEDVRQESMGVEQDGIRWYPKAGPVKIFRIFKENFASLPAALAEISKFKILTAYLPPGGYAMSAEFLVEYRVDDASHLILCGLQDYVAGDPLDPWNLSVEAYPAAKTNRFKTENVQHAQKQIKIFSKQARKWLDGLKKMIMEAKFVPDLAGIGNLLLTSDGKIVLVDINNISPVSFSSQIHVDDKGYPVCDKSIEAIALLEANLTGKPLNRQEDIYRIFLDPARMKTVKKLEDRFHQIIGNAENYPDSSRRSQLAFI